MTIGMSGLAIASFVQSGLELGWVSDNQGVQLGLILLAIPFLLQLLASIFSYLARDGVTGAAVGVLSVSWLAIALIDVAAGTSKTSGPEGLMQLASAAVLSCSAAAVSTTKPLPGAVFLLAAVRFACAGIYQLSSTGTWQHISGAIGLVIAAGAAYCVLAFELESQKHRPVLPTLRRGRGAAAISETPSEQLRGVANESGVRQTT
jgi:succinate-acetate transporter protein